MEANTPEKMKTEFNELTDSIRLIPSPDDKFSTAPEAITHVAETLLLWIENNKQGAEELKESIFRFIVNLARSYPLIYPIIFQTIASWKRQGETSQAENLESWLASQAETPYSDADFQKVLAVTSQFNLPLMGVEEDEETVAYRDLRLRTQVYLGFAAHGERLYEIQNNPDNSERSKILVLLWRELLGEIMPIEKGLR